MSDSAGSPSSSTPAPTRGTASPPKSSQGGSAPPPNSLQGGSAPPSQKSSPPPSQKSSPPPSSNSSSSGPPPSTSAPPPSTPPPTPSKSSPPPSSPPPSSKTPPPAVPPPADTSSGSPPPSDTSSGSPPSAPTVSPSPPPPPPPPRTSSPPSSPPPSFSSSPPPPPPSSSSSPPPSSSSPPPPADASSPAPPQDSSSPPPPWADVQSPPPSSTPQSAPTKPKIPPSESKSPPPPQAPRQASPNAPPPKPSTESNGTTGSPSRILTPPASSAKNPSGGSDPPPSNGGNGNSYQGKTMVGVAVAGVAIIALIAVVFLVRRRKKRRTDTFGNSQYMPPPNFSVKSDGYYYSNNPATGYSGQSGSMHNSQQNSSAPNSFGSQRGYMQSGGNPDSAVLGGAKTHFSYEDLMEITNGFSRQNVLGEGGFGCVYKGTSPDGKVVAVKQLKAGSGQGDREFKAEVEIISRVHHRHLVSLVGYCISDQHRLLIYEFVPNKTLEHHLHGKGMPVLEWAKRVKIAIGSAKGLAYLHEDCHPKIIHRDIKSANILLDDDFEAQVADFGLARLNDTTQTHVSTRVMGTFGYLAPEYASSGKLTDRSDVFSFGVVLLELITGRKPVDANQPLGEESLVEWARPLLLRAVETGDFVDLIDPRLEKHYVESEVFRMIETAAACVRHSAPKRPRMVQVVRALDSVGDISDINNGVKVGQSTAYDSGQYSQDIMNFRRMAFGFDDSSDSGMSSGDYSLRSSRRSQGASSEFTRNDSQTRAFNNRRF